MDTATSTRLIPRSFKFRDEDMAAIELIRRKTGISNNTEAIRVALNDFARRVAEGSEIVYIPGRYVIPSQE
jgi:hypothetical protein